MPEFVFENASNSSVFSLFTTNVVIQRNTSICFWKCFKLTSQSKRGTSGVVNRGNTDESEG